MRPARIIALTAALVAAFVVSGPAHAGGSDSPTPYTVTATGINLPRPLAAHDHVNIRLTDGTSRGLHLDPNNGHPGARWIGASFLPWSALGITDGCVSWVQVAGYDEHFGEGGQSPVCLSTTPTPEPSWTAEPEPSEEPTPKPSPTSPEPSSSPSPTQPEPSPEPSVTVAPTSEPEPEPSSSSPSPTSTPTPSSTPSTEPSPDLPPGPDVDHPTAEPDLPTDDPTATTIPEPTPELGTPPAVDTLPVTGAETTVAWIAGGLLALGAVLVMVTRRRA